MRPPTPGATNRTTTTQILAVGLYLGGGLAATAAYRALAERDGSESASLSVEFRHNSVAAVGGQ
jgi:hypothetical protein